MKISNRYAVFYSFNYYYLIIFLFYKIEQTKCSTHWKVTELGRIESNEDSIFTLLRPYDLASFLKQAERLKRLNYLKDLISAKELSAKKETKNTVSVSSYQENFYKTDSDCVKAGQQLTKFSFYETHIISWHTLGFYLPKESIEVKRSEVKVFKKPYCDIVNLPFNMKTFDHLDSIQSKANITMLPETDLLANILIEPEDFYGHLINVALSTNSSSWVYLAMAGDFFRIKGDYENSIKCFQRSIYYAPSKHQNIPVLSLSNMLHKLHFINDSLAVALTGISIDSENPLFAYYLGNIYVTLGELNSAYVWYERASNIDKSFKQARLKKHAVACHIKLEDYLESQHLNLQKKLDELKDYQSYSDEWFQISSKFELEKSSLNRKEFTKKAYEDFLTNIQSIICDWNYEAINDFKLNCKHLPIHYTFLPFNNQTLLVNIINRLNSSSKKKLNSNSQLEEVEEEEGDDDDDDEDEENYDDNESSSDNCSMLKQCDYNKINNNKYKSKIHNINNDYANLDNEDKNNHKTRLNNNDNRMKTKLCKNNKIENKDSSVLLDKSELSFASNSERIIIERAVKSKIKPPTSNNYLSDFG